MLEVTLRPDARVGARSLLASTEVVAAATAAHALAADSSGGPGPTTLSVLILAAVTLPATILVLRHRVSMRLALALLLGAQGVTHMVLSTAPTMSGSGAMSHGHDPWHLSWQMVLAHVVSALITALVWRARRHLLDVAVTWPTSYDITVAAPRLLTGGIDHVVRAAEWLRSCPLRGPPLIPAHT